MHFIRKYVLFSQAIDSNKDGLLGKAELLVFLESQVAILNSTLRIE